MSIPNVHRLIPKFLRVNGLTANSNELSHNYGTYKIYSINKHGPFSEKIGDFEDENYLYMNKKNLVRHKSLNNESQSYAKRYYSTKEGSKPNKLLHIYGRRCYATKPENVKGKLMHEIQKPIETFDDKVTVVGIGAVGMACAFTSSILSQGISNNLVLIDMFENKLEGEMMDLQHGSLFLKDPKITASTDYAVSAGSRVCVVTAGVRQKDNESRTDLLQRNADLMKNIIPHLVEYSPNAVLLIVSNPCDVLSYVAWKISGFPMTRIIGSGTNLDTSRFRYMIANRLNIAPASVHAWIIGEHGDTSVAVWSALNVAGVRLRDINPKIGTREDPDRWEDIHKEVVLSAYNVIKKKGYTNWAIGLSVTSMVHSILKNMNSVHAVSTLIKGLHGVKEEVYLSLPCTLGQRGVLGVIQQVLTPTEREALQKSARIMAELIKGVHI